MAVKKTKSKVAGKSTKSANHVFTGELTLQKISEVKEAFLKTIDSAKTINISFSNVSDADLSFVQLICSAHRTSVNEGKALVFTGAWPDSFINLTKESGLTAHVGCSVDGDIICPWLTNTK